MDIKAINTAIITGSFSNDELASVIDAVKFARSRLAEQVKFSIKAGDKVKWNSQKQGVIISGSVVKVAQKYATVSTPQGQWKVPMNMLETV